jgi:cytidyltransferase-like protein
MSKVLVFGTFDGIHDGHRAMLREAKTHGTFLVVAVAPDEVATELKFAKPKNSSAKRISLIKAERIADDVLIGDEQINSWKILKRCKPDVIALGYDQDELRHSLEEYLEKMYPDESPDEDPESRGFQKAPKKPKIIVLSPYKPDLFHNRILRS